ncbi:DNA alkylation repair protein [Ignavibacteriales bacterium]
MTTEEVLGKLESLGRTDVREGRARYGIRAVTSYGVPLPGIKSIAKMIKKDHQLALSLWKSGNHDARILSFMIADPKEFTMEDAEEWMPDMKSWDLTDGAAIYLFRRCDWVIEKVNQWINSEEEFIRRQGFVLMAVLAVHGKKLPNSLFIDWLDDLFEGASDKRNFVKKAVNWGIRQIGKKNKTLRQHALITCERILSDNEKINWIALDAKKELNDPKIVARIKEV